MKKTIIALLIFVSILSFFSKIATATELRQAGFGLSIGTKDPYNVVGDDDGSYNFASVSIYMNFIYSLANYKQLNGEIIPTICVIRAWNDDRERYGVTLGGDLWLNYKFFETENNYLFSGPGIGIHVLIPSNRQPEYASTGILGMAGIRAGLSQKIKKNIFVRFIVSYEHTSDMLDSNDSGREEFQGKIEFSFPVQYISKLWVNRHG